MQIHLVGDGEEMKLGQDSGRTVTMMVKRADRKELKVVLFV